MTRYSTSFLRHAAVALALVAIAACGQHKPTRPSPPKPPEGTLHLSLDQIPTPPAALPVLRLEAQRPPGAFVEEVLRRSAPEATSLGSLKRRPELVTNEPLPAELLGAFDGDHLAAYVNQRTGDAEIFPSFTRQKPVSAAREDAQLQRATRLARDVFARPDLFRKDATELTIDKPRPLYGAKAERSAAGADVRASERALYLTYVPARRSVQGHYVYGPGSRGLVVVGTDGQIHGLVRRWKLATVNGEARESRTREQVADAIRAQLRTEVKRADVTVMDVEVAYYDGNRDYLQPVYRFTARIHELSAPPKEQRAHVNDDFVIGYLPIGAPKESVPSLDETPKQNPNTPPKAVAAGGGAPPPGDPTVGRYVVRNDDSNWVADANEFWAGVSSFAGNFTDAQYYWAYPFEFGSNESQFVDEVNVALTEVHGDWWLFSTLMNCCDLVDITTIPATQGYGAAGRGSLAYWILHSCEVVPSAEDAPCPTDARPWWTPWFNIFQGLHTAVGYRTIMWIDDDVGFPFGLGLRFGAPVVSAWFNATTSAAGYQGNPTFGAHCNRSPPMGRPSTVSFCGRENDWVYDTSPLPAAGCLINYWQPN